MSDTATVITTAPVVRPDPRVYTDPYPDAKGSDLVQEPCWKCGGDGLYHAPSGFVIQNPYGRRGDTIRGCFACLGVGHRVVKVSSVRARIRRDIKAILQRDTEAAAHAATAAEHAAAQWAADWDEAHAEQTRRAALNNSPAGDLGDKLSALTGTVTVATTIEVPGFRGYGTDLKRLIVITLDSGQVLKTIGTGATLFNAHRHDRVTISGTVKDFDDYRGQTQTVLTRAKVHIDTPAPRFEAIDTGDHIQTAGDWYPVVRVDDDVHVLVTLGQRSWTSPTRRDTITGHRPATD